MKFDTKSGQLRHLKRLPAIGSVPQPAHLIFWWRIRPLASNKSDGDVSSESNIGSVLSVYEYYLCEFRCNRL